MAFTIIRHNVVNDQAATQQTQVTGNSLEIGRGSGNALLLDDLHISLRHAVIDYVDGRYVIKDLDSRGGTYVNHRAVRMQPLANGDVVHIGNFNLRLGVPSDAGPLTIDVMREGTEEVAENAAPVSYLSHYRLSDSLFTKKRLTWWVPRACRRWGDHFAVAGPDTAGDNRMEYFDHPCPRGGDTEARLHRT